MAIDPSAEIHPTAIVESGAEIGPGCRIGPYAHIGPEVRLAEGVWVKSHAVVTGWTEIGPGTVIFPFAVVGEIPQDLKYRGERTRLIVGARCRIREAATLNTGTAGGGGVTRVGDDCLIMTGAHVGHDAELGSNGARPAACTVVSTTSTGSARIGATGRAMMLSSATG